MRFWLSCAPISSVYGDAFRGQLDDLGALTLFAYQ
jgi:hypothetical protein